MKTIFIYTVLISIGVASAGIAFAESVQDPMPMAITGKNFIDCVERLSAQGSGWCEMKISDDHPSISSVWPSIDSKTHMVTGPVSILTAWNSAAFDEEKLTLYFFGGGHADYGGNEVYSYSLMDAKWERLTDPSSLDHLYEVYDGRYCWVPNLLKVPSSVHTYDGLEFNSFTKTIFLITRGIANGSCFGSSDISTNDSRLIGGTGKGIYEFNPSKTRTRNGLPPLTWRLLRQHNYNFPRLAFGKKVLAGSSDFLFNVDPLTLEEHSRHSQIADWGDGSLTYDKTRDWYWSTHRKAIMAFDADGKKTYELRQSAPHGKSTQVTNDGLLVAWDGGSRIVELDIEKERFELLDWAGLRTSKGDSRVYGKWRYVPKYDVFVGISNHETGVWVYRHPKGRAVPIAKQSAQEFIDSAAPGSTVSIPPGIYFNGIKIDKNLTVNLKNVKLNGVYGGKAVINVNCDGCRVTVNDLEVNGFSAGCLSGNCAGIKMEGVNPKVTVNRAQIDNTVMGVLTDNRGGTLIINDSVIENTGLDDKSFTLGHGFYAGSIDQAVLNNSVIRNVNSKGHLFKSRAKNTKIIHSRLEGNSGYHSRSIDFPCGGSLVVKNSFINHGKNTDNADIISVGTESGSCGDELVPSAVEITDCAFVIDRTRDETEPAWNAGETGLFNWKGPYHSLHVSNNKFVFHKSAGWRWNYGSQEIPDQADQNQFCETKKACGI